jgi:hypothetical protein
LQIVVHGLGEVIRKRHCGAFHTLSITQNGEVGEEYEVGDALPQVKYSKFHKANPSTPCATLLPSTVRPE